MMSTRFSLDTLALVAGGFTAVISRSFDFGPLSWTAFGVSAAVAVAGILGLALNGLGRGSVASGALTVVGLWSLVAALVFSGSALTWLVFADALAVAAIALADLTVHEVTTERVVHTLDVRHEHDAPLAA
jgi:hypothetical protein